VSVATSLYVGQPGFDSRREPDMFLLATASRSALWSIDPIQWVPRREAHHSRPYSAEVKNKWSYISSPRYIFMVWCLIKQHTSSWRGTRLSARTTLPVPYLTKEEISLLQPVSSWHDSKLWLLLCVVPDAFCKEAFSSAIWCISMKEFYWQAIKTSY
jgi:hypothetical protein